MLNCCVVRSRSSIYIHGRLEDWNNMGRNYLQNNLYPLGKPREFTWRFISRKAERINKSFRSFDCSLSVNDPKTQTTQHLVILFESVCVSMKSLFYEPEQNPSARTSVCINEGYESIFSRVFQCTLCVGSVRSLRAHKIRQLQMRWISSRNYLHRRLYYKYINYCLIPFSLYSNTMLLFYGFH